MSTVDTSKQVKGKIIAVGVSASVSVVYCIVSQLFVHDGVRLGTTWQFWTLVIPGVLIFVAGAFEWSSLPPEWKFPWPSWLHLSTEQGLGACLYAETLIYVLTLGWICFETGGPIRSPYSVVLLTVAVLSPFVTEEFKAMLVVVSLVAVCYLGGAFVYDAVGKPAHDAPDWLIAVNSMVSVLISLMLEGLRRRGTRLARRPSPGPHPGPGSSNHQTTSTAARPQVPHASPKTERSHVE